MLRQQFDASSYLLDITKKMQKFYMNSISYAVFFEGLNITSEE